MIARLRSIRIFGCGALLSAVAWAAAPASAQSPVAVPLIALAPAGGTIPVDLKVGVLNVIPDDALGFFVLADFDKSRDEVEGLMHKLKIPFDGTREYADFNDFLERLEGWDSKGQHAFAVLPGEPDPKPLLFVPVSDYKKFAAAVDAENDDGSPTMFEMFGKKSRMAAKANFAVITEHGADDEVLNRVVASKKSVAAACEPVRAWLGKQQVAGVVMPSTVQLGCDELLKLLEDAKQMHDGTAPEEITPYLPLLEIARKFAVKVVTAARADLTHLTFSVRIDEEAGITASGQAVFKAGGAFESLVKSSTPLPADCLRFLPAEQFIMSAAYTYPKGSTDALYELFDELLTEAAEIKDLPVDAEKLREGFAISRKLVDQLQYLAQMQSTAGPGMYDGVYGIYHVEDAAEFLRQNEIGMKKFIQAFDKFKDKLGGIEIGRKKVGEIDAYTVGIDMLALLKAFGAPEQPQQDLMMKAMFGGEGKMTMYFAVAAKDKVVMAYGESGLKTIVEAVKSGKAGLADDLMIKKTAALLSGEITAVGYLDFGGYIEFTKKMMGVVMAAQGLGNGGFPLPIPPFPDSPPLGYALKMRGNTASIEMAVPLELMENTRDFVMQMQGLVGALGR